MLGPPLIARSLVVAIYAALREVRFWHKADIIVLHHVRFRG
jgi:hypothetical protein